MSSSFCDGEKNGKKMLTEDCCNKRCFLGTVFSITKYYTFQAPELYLQFLLKQGWIHGISCSPSLFLPANKIGYQGTD